MANRFWVGGTGTWDGSDTSHWSATTGGGSGASVPGSADSAFFDNNSGGGTATVNTNFNILGITLGGYTGTLDFSVNNNSPTARNFSYAVTSTPTLKLGSGTFTLTGNNSTTNPWDFTTTGCTFLPGTSTLKLTSSAAQPVVFKGNGMTFNNVWFARGSSTQVNAISGSNTFNDLKDDGSAAHSLRFATGTTQTVTTFSVSGNSGALIIINTGTAVAAGTTTHTLSQSSGTVSSQYVDIQHSVAQGGATWNAINSTNNNSVATAGSGWIFTTGPVSVTDSLTLTENVSLTLISNKSVSDQLNITESVTVTISTPVVDLSVSVFDAITLTENLSQTEFFNISVFDSITITENLSKTEFFNISVFDSITLTESVTVQDTGLIYFDAAENSGDQAAASSYSGSASWNGSSRLLAVDVSMLGPGVTVNSMTYGGANCTLVGVQSTVTSFGRVEQWRIISSDPGAPAVGANTLVVTLSGSLEFSVEWVSYTGVHQTKPTEAFNSAQATNVGVANDASVVVTTVANNDWVHAAVVANDTSITAGNTSRNNISGTLGSGANEDNGGAKTPPGTVTMSYSGMGITTTWAIAGYAIRPLAAIGDISVSDSITITESVTTTEVLTGISVVDNITLTENTTQLLQGFISVVDSITLTESVIVEKVSYISVFDSITITENLGETEFLGIIVFDGITITEDVTVSVGSPGATTVSVFDSITLTESVSVNNTTGFTSVFDGITLTESTTLERVSFISVVDSIIISENLGQIEFLNIVVFDGITLTENLSEAGFLNIVVFDGITLTENLSEAGFLNIVVFDIITITENLTEAGFLNITVFDSITLTENLSEHGFLNIVIFDAITLTENLSELNFLSISISDSITLTENLSESVGVSINVFDIISLSENLTESGLLSINTNDTINISENNIIERISYISILDQINITELTSFESFRFSPSRIKFSGNISNNRALTGDKGRSL